MKFDCSYTSESGVTASLSASVSLSDFAPLSEDGERRDGAEDPETFLAERCLLEISRQLVSTHQAIAQALSVASLDLLKKEVDLLID